MKMIKRIAALTFAITVGTSAFAQQSFKKQATAGLFGTEVDDFMSVTGWSNVKPENLFGFLGYNWSGGSRINLGLARNVKKTYTAFYFGGQLDSFTTKAETATTASPSTKTTTTNLTSTGNGIFEIGALIGTGNMGFKVNVFYDPDTINNTDTNTDGTKGKNYTEKFTLTPTLTWGLRTNVKKTPAKFTAGTYLGCKVNKTKSLTGGTQTKTDSSTYLWNIFGSAEFEGKSTKTTSSAYGAGFGTSVEFKGNDSDTVTRGGFTNNIYITPYYSFTAKPTPTLSIKAKPSATLQFDNNIDPTETINKTTSTTTFNNRNDFIDVTVRPALSLASVYALKKDKVDFNIGGTFLVPNMRWHNYSNKTCNPTTGDVTAKSTGVDYSFVTASGEITLSSGFTAYIAKTVTLDLNWNIAGNIMNGFRADFENGATTNAFFGNFNKVLFGSDIGLLVSVKL